MLDQLPAPIDVFRALADPTRMAIVERLLEGEATVSELAGPLGISLAAVVQQVNLLEGFGLVMSRKVGRVRTCCIDYESLALAETWISAVRARWERQRDQADKHDAQEGPAPC
jgi:DNA-binding transcriptional ArsR family regulator